MSFIEVISFICIVIGLFFVTVAGIGLWRMPDLFLRMSATTEAATLGIGFILLGTAVYFYNDGISIRVIATIVFVFLTAPVSSHMIARAAYSDNVPLWKGTRTDQLRQQYRTDPETNLTYLDSFEEETENE